MSDEITLGQFDQGAVSSMATVSHTALRNSHCSRAHESGHNLIGIVKPVVTHGSTKMRGDCHVP
jgi:hypothetical protein